MSGSLPVSLRETRERTIARLSDAFAADDLEMDEFERRLTLAHTARDVAELETLLADLPAPSALGSTPAPQQQALARAPAAEVRATESIVAIMGGSSRKGRWLTPRKLKVRAIMGGVELDFRDARLPPGETVVEITAVMGGAEIIVPPGLAVRMNGTAIMGGFEHMDRAPESLDADQSVLTITGFCVMGGVAVETRLPGESSRQARRRHDRELRDARRSERKQLRERND